MATIIVIMGKKGVFRHRRPHRKLFIIGFRKKDKRSKKQKSNNGRRIHTDKQDVECSAFLVVEVFAKGAHTDHATNATV
jgi:hypothetical protein